MSNARFGLRVRNGLVRGITEGLTGIDSDAGAFISAAGITNPIQQSAIIQLVLDLKSFGLWTKMKAIYPFVGGTASAHKFNLKDPRDLDVAFRLLFFGGWTHSVNGVLPNGTNAYADTFLNENSILTVNNEHISIYSRTNIDATQCDIGVGLGSIETNIFSKLGNLFYPRVHDSNAGISNTTSSLGLFVSNRINTTQIRAFQNGVLRLISSNSNNSKRNLNFYISALSSSTGPSLYSSRELAFASIGDGLTDIEGANFYTAVQNFQTTLGRQV